MNLKRRDVLKGAALTAGALALSKSSSLLATPGMNGEPLQLSVAGYPYNHVRPLMDKTIKVKGCEVDFSVDKIGHLNNHVFEGPQTRGISEIGLAPFILAYANDQFRDYSLIPVFPLRTYRHKSIFVRTDSGIEDPSQLKGKRIGTPGYSQTSLQWIRGILQDEYGLRAEDVEWVVSAKDSSAATTGNPSKNENVFPDGLKVATGPVGKDESDLLVDGDVDALFHAVEPRAFALGDPRVRRLFPDSRATEQDYFRRTGIFPIMHAVAIRNDLAQEHPWLPEAVFRAYSEAKTHAYKKMRAEWFFETMPWYAEELAATKEIMGDNFFPYGIEPNRKTVETLFRYSYEQGLASRQLTIKDLFESSTLNLLEA